MANEDRAIHSTFPDTTKVRWYYDAVAGTYVQAVHIDSGDTDNPLQVATNGISMAVAPTVTAGAYTAGDAVGELLIFANAARTTGGGGVVKSVVIVDDAGQDVEMELWLFYDTITDVADNAPWAPTEGDLHKLDAIISTADGAWFAAGTPSVARVECSQRYSCGGLNLYGKLVTRGAPTFAATDDIMVIIGLLRD